VTPVQGLEAFWARRTGSAPSGALTMAERILLDARGLGLEQALTYLRDRPDFATFEAWIAATAGPPDAERIARYHAWLAGEQPPEATQARLAAIEAMPPALDADDLTHWEAHGFVILRGAIGLAEAAAGADLLWRVADPDPDDRATWYGPRNNGIMVQHFCDPALDVARYAPRIHKAFAQLWGTADLWSIVDRMSFSAPPAPGRPWQGPLLHWDASLALPIPFATQGILYLTDRYRSGRDAGRAGLPPPDRGLAGVIGRCRPARGGPERGSRDDPGKRWRSRHLATGLAPRREPEQDRAAPARAVRQHVPRDPGDQPGLALGRAQTGLAPGVPHLANLPFSLQRTAGFGAAGAHLMNLPLASLHGAAIAGAEPARTANAAAAMTILVRTIPSFSVPVSRRKRSYARR
jgi:hypothetical protein